MESVSPYRETPPFNPGRITLDCWIGYFVTILYSVWLAAHYATHTNCGRQSVRGICTLASYLHTLLLCSAIPIPCIRFPIQLQLEIKSVARGAPSRSPLGKLSTDSRKSLSICPSVSTCRTTSPPPEQVSRLVSETERFPGNLSR